MSGIPYAPFFCDENVWQFLRMPSPNERWAVFLGNPGRAVALWCQRTAPVPGEIVVWDYHVVALERTSEGFLLHDPDCFAGCPMPALEWTETSFPSDRILVSSEPPLFRVVPAQEFLAGYRSDRRHMAANPAPPPPWPPLTPGECNLPAYLFGPESGPQPGLVLDEASWRALLEHGHVRAPIG